MSDARANIIITADPKAAQQGLQRVKGSLADMEVQSKKLMGEFRNLAKGTKEFADKARELQDVNRRIRDLKDSVSGLHDKARATTLASQALGSALGFLGVNSVQGVVAGFMTLSRQAIQLAMNIEGVEARARAVFGASFPQVEQAASALAGQLGRGTGAVLEMQAGFAILMDSMGASARQVNAYSTEMSRLAIVLGKSRPDLADAQVYQMLEAGILGNTRGLRELGIVMGDAALQTFATSKGYKTLVKDMDDQQLMLLRVKFLLEETTTQQRAAALAAGGMGDKAKEAAEEWNDFLEGIGRQFGPWANAGKSAVADMVSSWMDWIGSASVAFAGLFGSMPGFSGDPRKGGFRTDLVPKEMQAKFRALPAPTRELAPSLPLPSAGEDGLILNRPGRPAGGGAGKSEEQLAREIEAAESRILSAMGEQARAQSEALRSRREDLKLRERMGVLSKDERRELDQINRRTAFKKELLDEATKAWEEQVKVIEQAEGRVKSLSEKIAEERKSLKDALADIGKDFGEQRTDAIAELIAERNELEGKLRRLEGLSPKEQDRAAELDGILSGLSPEERAAGRAQEASNPLEKLEREKQLRIQEAQEKANARLADLQADLDAENRKLAELRSAEEQKKQAVITALAERGAAVKAALDAELEAVRANVAAQVAEFNRLSGPGKQTGATKNIPALAEGGIVTRPTLALIGERGPEAVIPLGKGGGMGVSVVIQSMTVYKEADVDEVIRRITRAIQLQQFQSA